MSALTELRVLEGPNLYFPRAAMKLTLDVSRLVDADESMLRDLARAVGVSMKRPGGAGSGFRQRSVMRLLEAVVRRLARDAGTTRLAVRVRPTSDPQTIVVAYPWRGRHKATSLGEAIGMVLDGGPEAFDEAVAKVRSTEPGPAPTTIKPRVPVVAVTGTNGKTTTSRMIAHIARCAGLLTGWSNTDGIYIDGELIEAGDYSGPSGAGRVLAHPQVKFAVTETARGGILLKGIGLAHNHVSVVTNVTADHLGLQGIDTLDQLAEVKGVVPRITKRSGWAVLNADDPRVLAMPSPAQRWVFTRNADSPAIRATLESGGRATTVIDGQVTVLVPGREPMALLPLTEVPMTLAGLSRFNVENALAAASAGLAIGISADHVVEGLRTFKPDAEHNPGRMNFFSYGEVSVVLDLAHNEAGLEALLEIMRGVAGSTGRLLLGLGVVGDRTEDLIENLGEIAAKNADVVVIGHKLRYLRGRTVEELESWMRAGAARVGVTELATYETELESLQALLAQAHPGDVVGLMLHAQRDEVPQWLFENGASADSPETLAEKVRRAQASYEA